MEVLRSAVQRARESLFFTPSLIVGLFVAAARGAVYLDDQDELADAPFVLSVSVSGGRTIAAAVAAATITVAAIVFSITALSSQIASTQYSPRSVSGFFEDRFQQLVIGLVVGTFSFALLVLAALGDVTVEQGVFASVSVTLTVVLGIAAVFAILAYLDHSLRRMRIGPTVRRIAEATAQSVRRASGESENPEELERLVPPQQEPVQIHSDRTGWVRAIDARRLARALPSRSVARVEVRVGEAVSSGDLLATMWGVTQTDHVRRAFERSVHVGRDRTLATDPAFGIRQLVDIGLRALSPGINDPTTAIDVIAHLKLPMREILVLDQPSRIFAGPGGQRVFLTEAPSRSDHVHTAFAEIRLAAKDQPAVLRGLIEVLADLIGELESADLDSRSTALREEAALVVEAAGEAGFPESDLQRVLAAGEGLGLTDQPE